MMDHSALRKEFGLDRTDDIFFNTGSSGPVPQAAWAGIDRYREIVTTAGPCGPRFHKEVDPVLAQLRRWTGELLGCGATEIAFTAHTTHGLALALNARRWQPGDKILVARNEYITGQQNCRLLARRYKTNVIEFDLSNDHHYDHAMFLDLLDRHRPDMVLVSHLTYNTAELLPVQKICQAAREQGAWSLVDGAQAVGQIPVDVREIGSDFYAFPAHKWLGGPEGVGFLHVRPEIVDDCLPLALGYLSQPYPPPVDPMILHDDARRFETASPAFPSLFAIHGSLSVLRGIGIQDWQERIRSLAGRAYAGLEKRPDIQLLTPVADRGRTGLIPFRKDGESPAATVKRLGRAGINCRTIPDPDALRISLHPANSEEEVDRFLEVI